MKGQLFHKNEDQLGPGNCPACHKSTDATGEYDDDQWCEYCQGTSSEYFGHHGAAEEFLKAVKFGSVNIEIFLKPKNRDPRGIRWDDTEARRLLVEAEIPTDKLEEVIFHAVAIVYSMEQELLWAQRVQEAEERRAEELRLAYEDGPGDPPW